MAGNDIKQKIVLEGEKQYRDAIKDAQRNLKTLRSELKAETAELGANATAQEKNAAKIKSLKQQIAEQEKIVKANKAALEEVKEKYADNADAIAKYEQKLNDARTALANMKNGLDDTTRSLGNVGNAAKSSGESGIVAMNSLSESIKRVGDAADSISSSMESAFKNVIGVISGAITDLYADVMEVAGKANGWTDMAAMFGASATEIQKWENTLKAAGKDFSVLGGMMTRLARGKTDKGITEWLGISNENYTNELEYTLLIMERLREQQKEMGASDFNRMLTENFKGSENDIRWFLANYDYLMGKQDKYDADQGGFGLTDEQIEKMDTLYKRVQDIKTSWEALKSSALVMLTGDLALQISGNFQNIVEAFKEYLDAGGDEEKKKAALGKIKDNIKQIFKAIQEAIKEGVKMLNELAQEFKNDDDPTSQTIGNVIQAIADTIAWLADPANWEKIKAGIQIVLGFWLFTKLAAVASALGGIVTSLGGIMGFRGGGLFGGKGGGAPVVTGGGSGAGGAAATGGTAAAGGAAKTGFFAKLGASGALHGAAVAGGGLALIAGGVYALSEYVNAANARAAKEREVTRDENRYANLNDADKAYLQKMVRDIQHEQGGSAKVAPMLEQLAGRMGTNLLDIFDYTNTSGEKRNKLVDMLSMDNESAAIAAMMLQAAGVDTSGMGSAYSSALALWNQFKAGGKTDFTGAYTTLAGRGGFWDLSGNSNGLFTIPGFNGVPVVTGNGPNPWELSGYANTGDANKPRWSNGSLWWGRPDIENTWGLNGTWDPTRNKVEISNDGVNGIKNAVRDGVSGIKVYMDKEIVGRLVAPTVSMEIAREVQ